MSSTSQGFPDIPFEIFTRIVYYCLYNGNECSQYLQSDDITGDLIPFRQRETNFLAIFATVSRAVHRLAITLIWRAILVSTPQELVKLRDALDDSPLCNEIDLGALCRRLELRVAGTYDVSYLVDVLRRMPNLEVFILRNVWTTRPQPDRVQPVALVEALTRYNKHLARVQFESPREDLNVSLVKKLLCGLPLLATIHIDKVSMKSTTDDVSPLDRAIPALEVLSVGTLRRQPTRDLPFRPTGHLLRCFPTASILPSLSTVYLQDPSDETHRFLTTFGPQLEEIGFPIGAAWVPSMPEGHAMQYCPSLRRVMCTVSKGLSDAEFFPLWPHPCVESVALCYVERPFRSFRSDVIENAVRLLCGYGGALRTIIVFVPPHLWRLSDSSFDDLRRVLDGDGVALCEGPTVDWY